jgi:hypothetical protein
MWDLLDLAEGLLKEPYDMDPSRAEYQDKPIVELPEYGL